MKFRKKPVVIEAKELTINSWKEIMNWVGISFCVASVSYPNDGVTLPTLSGMRIKTLEGEMWADPGDWIIKGIKGEFYPCKPDIFEMTYEAAE